MEATREIQKLVEETVERKLAEILPIGLKFPLPLIDQLVLQKKKVKILVEVYEDSVVAYVLQDRDIFAEGPTIRKAKANLRAAILDEYDFFQKHRRELSKDLTRKLSLLQGILE